MAVNVEVINKTGEKVDHTVFDEGLLSTLRKRNINGNFEVTVHLVGEGAALSLNKKYRGKNYVPEVLSFPIEERVSEKSATLVLLGDIFLCLPEVKKRAKLAGHSVEAELQFLASHGTDHLLGLHHKERK